MINSHFDIGPPRAYYFGYINNPPHNTPIKGFLAAVFPKYRVNCGDSGYINEYLAVVNSLSLVQTPARRNVKKNHNRPGTAGSADVNARKGVVDLHIGQLH